ncbi:MAG: tetratricopeptide repeat protein, partial [Halothece sp.]
MIPHLAVNRQVFAGKAILIVAALAVSSFKPVHGQSLPVLTPTTPEAVKYLNQGLQQARTGNTESAIASFEQAVALDKNLAPAHYNLGLALKDEGNLQAAADA